MHISEPSECSVYYFLHEYPVQTLRMGLPLEPGASFISDGEHGSRLDLVAARGSNASS